MAEPITPDIREVFVDESSQTKHRYLVLGCITLSAARSTSLCEAIQTARLPELPQGEMGWVKVSRSKLVAYRRVVDLFFDAAWSDVHFHAAVIDTARQDHRRFNAGNREIGFSKEIYLLMQKCRRLYGNDLFHVYPDRRTTSQRLEELRLILNRGARKSGDNRDWPFRRLHWRDSSDCLQIQLADILTGALAFHLNGHVKEPNASPAKVELSDAILRTASIKNVFRDTAVRGKFTVWHRQLR